MSVRKIAICVPVRNEEKEIANLLRGIAAQQEVDLASVTLCLFLDGCTDRSATILHALAPTLPYRMMIEIGAPHPIPNAGRARRAAMEVGLAALADRDGILLTTDADSVPAPDWIARSGDALLIADVVAGHIVRQATEPCSLQDRIEAYYDRLCVLRRQLDPVPWDSQDPHHFTGGANLGFTQHAYRALGGFQPLPCGEDARIIDDAARLGLRVRRDRGAIVETSARRDGRALGGLASHLQEMDGSRRITASFTHPADATWQYRMQAHARATFEAQRFQSVAKLLDLPLDHIIGVARDCENGEAFAMRIVPVPPGGIRQIGLDEAEYALSVLELQQIDQAA